MLELVIEMFLPIAGKGLSFPDYGIYKSSPQKKKKLNLRRIAYFSPLRFSLSIFLTSFSLSIVFQTIQDFGRLLSFPKHILM